MVALLLGVMAAPFAKTVQAEDKSIEDYQNEGYKAYIIPYDTSERPTTGNYSYDKRGSDTDPFSAPYEGLQATIDGKTYYFYKSVGAAVVAAKAGNTNVNYATSSNPSGAVIEGQNNEKNDSLNENLGAYTDTVVLLCNGGNAEAIFNQGSASFANGASTTYGIHKGIILDMNGHHWDRLSAGHIPDGQTLIVKNGSISVFDDEVNTPDRDKQPSGNIILSNMTASETIFANQHSFYLLDGNYKVEFGGVDEDPNLVKLMGGRYSQNPATLSVNVDYADCHIEETGDSNYPYKIVKGPTLYNLKLDYNGKTVNNETYKLIEDIPYDQETDLQPYALTYQQADFLGWNTEAAPSTSKPGTSYALDAKVKELCKEHRGTITLYANWEEYTVTMEKDSYVYNGSAQTPEITVTSKKEGVEKTLIEGVDYDLYQDTAKTDVGNYAVNVLGKDRKIHKTLNWSITPAECTVIPKSSYSKHVGSKDPDLSGAFELTFGANTNPVTLSGIKLVRDKGEKAGTYQLRVTDQENVKKLNPNCKLTFRTATFTITDHKWDKGSITKQATETNEGVLTYACTICGSKKTESIKKLLVNNIKQGIKVSKSGNKYTVKWGKVSNAAGYKLYAAYCGTNKYYKVATVKDPLKTSVSFTKLNSKSVNKKANIKLYVMAYNGNGKEIARSIEAHIVGIKNTKETDAKEVKVGKASYVLKVGQTAKIKAKVVLKYPKRKELDGPHCAHFRYDTTDKKVATVSKGVIKAKGKGSCIVYVYARTGIAKAIKIVVK